MCQLREELLAAEVAVSALAVRDTLAAIAGR